MFVQEDNFWDACKYVVTLEYTKMRHIVSVQIAMEKKDPRYPAPNTWDLGSVAATTSMHNTTCLFHLTNFVFVHKFKTFQTSKFKNSTPKPSFSNQSLSNNKAYILIFNCRNVYDPFSINYQPLRHPWSNEIDSVKHK